MCVCVCVLNLIIIPIQCLGVYMYKTRATMHIIRTREISKGCVIGEFAYPHFIRVKVGEVRTIRWIVHDHVFNHSSSKDRISPKKKDLIPVRT